MGVRSRIGAAIDELQGRQGPEALKAQAPAGGQVARLAVLRGTPHVRKMNTLLLRQWAENSEWVRAAINVRRSQVSQTEWDIVPIDPTQPWDAELRNRIHSLFSSPNTRRDSFRSMIEPVVEDLLVLDAGAIEKQQNPKSEPVYLWHVDPQWLRIDPLWDGSDPTEARYHWYPFGVWKAGFTNDQLLYMMANPASYRVMGLSPLEVLKETIESDIAAARYNKNMVLDAVPSGIINLGEGADVEQVDKFKFYFDNEVAGRRQTAVVGGTTGIQFVPFGQNNREMQFMQWQIYLIRKIAAVFGISAQDLQITFDINRATSETQMTMTEDRGLRPLLTLIEEYLNREIVGDFAEAEVQKRFYSGRLTDKDRRECLTLLKASPREHQKLYARMAPYNLTNLMFAFSPLNSRSADKQAEINHKALGGLPWKTLNEARKDDNLPPIEGGDEIFVMTNLGPVPLDAAAEQAQAQAGTEGAPPSKTFVIPKSVVELQRPKALSASTTEARLQTAVASYFQKLADLIDYEKVAMTVFAAMQTVPETTKAFEGSDWEKTANALVSSALWEQMSSDQALDLANELRDELSSAYQASFSDGAQSALGDLGISTSFQLENPKVLSLLDSQGLQRVKGFGDETLSQMRTSLVNGLRDGHGVDVLARSLRQKVLDMSVDRSKRIANTEAAWAMSRGAVDTYEKNGLAEKEWKASGKNVCAKCRANVEAGAIGVKELFPSGDQHPGAHPDCHCAVLPVVPFGKICADSDPSVISGKMVTSLTCWETPGDCSFRPSAGSLGIPEFDIERYGYGKTLGAGSNVAGGKIDYLADAAYAYSRGFDYKGIQDTSKRLMQDPSSFRRDDPNQAAAAQLLNAVASGPTFETLYRGIRLKRKDAHRLLDELSNEEKDFSLPLSSFTMSRKVAKIFSEKSAKFVGVRVVAHNIRGCDIDPWSNHPREDEVLSAGNFKIDKYVDVWSDEDPDKLETIEIHVSHAAS